jgi:hypothetical protein
MNAESVYNMLQRKGKSATIRIYNDESFNPGENKVNRGNYIDHPLKIVPPYRNREGYKKSELITSGKGLTGIANFNLEFTVKAGIIIVINSKIWTVISVSPVENSSGILFYSLEIESGS